MRLSIVILAVMLVLMLAGASLADLIGDPFPDPPPPPDDPAGAGGLTVSTTLIVSLISIVLIVGLWRVMRKPAPATQ